MDGPALLFGVLIPAIFAGVVLLFSARARRAEPSIARPFAGALALGVAFLVAKAGLDSVPPLPFGPDALGVLGMIFWCVVAAIVLAPLRTAPVIGRFGNAFYVALFSILPYHLIRDSSKPASAFDAGGFATVLIVYALWSSLERLARRRPGPSLPLALWAACAGTAVVLLENRSALQAQLAGSLAAALGAAVVVTFLVRGSHLSTGAIAILAIVVSALLRQATIYDLPTPCWALLAVAFAAPWIGEIKALRRRSPLLAGVAAFLGALIPTAIAAWLVHDLRALPVY